MKPGKHELTLKVNLFLREEISAEELGESLLLPYRENPNSQQGYAVCHPHNSRWRTATMVITKIEGLPEEDKFCSKCGHKLDKEKSHG